MIRLSDGLEKREMFYERKRNNIRQGQRFVYSVSDDPGTRSDECRDERLFCNDFNLF